MLQSTTDTRRLYRQIAEQLRARIAAGDFPLGSRLPPERDLALQLGVSRPTVREAVIALEVEGLVEVRMGSGIYVIDTVAMPGAAASAAFGPLEIIRARQVVERELAAVVARSPRRGLAVAGLREAVAKMESDLASGVMPIAGDRQFHLCLAEACDNAALLRVVSELYDERENPLFERFGRLFEDVASWRKAVTEHRAVVDAVAEGDAVRARTAMHVHLELTHERFTAAWAEEPEARRQRAEAQPL
ncbi:MAG: FadR family transcriptional regulator [Burkholderiaceae bacterium]|nr:FadR family transcriptional regulator [Burkholderiaceae bacterium]